MTRPAGLEVCDDPVDCDGYHRMLVWYPVVCCRVSAVVSVYGAGGCWSEWGVDCGGVGRALTSQGPGLAGWYDVQLA